MDVGRLEGHLGALTHASGLGGFLLQPGSQGETHTEELREKRAQMHTVGIFKASFSAFTIKHMCAVRMFYLIVKM